MISYFVADFVSVLLVCVPVGSDSFWRIEVWEARGVLFGCDQEGGRRRLIIVEVGSAAAAGGCGWIDFVLRSGCGEVRRLPPGDCVAAAR